MSVGDFPAEVTAAAKARMEETVRLQAEAEAEAGKVGMEGTIRLQAEVEAEANGTWKKNQGTTT